MQPSPTQMSQLPPQVVCLPATPVAQQPVNGGYSENFNVQAGKLTGYVHILCGAVAIALGVVLWTYGYFTISGTISVGLWAGLLVSECHPHSGSQLCLL